MTCVSPQQHVVLPYVWLCRSLKVPIEPLLATCLPLLGKANCLVVARLAYLPDKLARQGKKILASVGGPNRLSCMGKVSSPARE